MEFGENYSDVFTCIQQTFKENHTSEILSPSFATATAVLQSLYQIVTLPFVLILNVLVILVIYKNKKLQTAPFFTALQVVCFNLVIAVTTTLSVVSSAIKGGWALGENLCLITAALSFLLGLTRTFLLAILAVDRSMYVFAPHVYPKVYKVLVLVLTALSWAIALLGSIIPIQGILDCYGYEPLNQVCYLAIPCQDSCTQYLTVFYVVAFTPACVVPAILYACMCCRALALKKHNSSERESSYHKTTLTFFLLFLSTVLLTLPLSVLGVLMKTATQSEMAGNIILLVSSMAIKSIAITDPLFILRSEAAKSTVQDIVRRTTRNWRSAIETTFASKSDATPRA